MAKQNRSGVAGVCFTCGKWNSKITINKKRYTLYSGESKEEAVNRRKEAEKHIDDFENWYGSFRDHKKNAWREYKVGDIVKGLEITGEVKKYKKNQTKFECKCVVCGKTYTRQQSDLKNGCSNCKRESKKETTLSQKRRDFCGRVINGLKVIDIYYDKYAGKDTLKCKCECSCGTVFDAFLNHVLSGNTTTCGHTRGEVLASAQKVREGYSIDNTNVMVISRADNRSVNKNSATKVTGVSFLNDIGKYRAYITFKGKQYHLGVYSTIEDAKQARKIAEEKIYGDFLKWYAAEYPEKWEKLNRGK